MHMSDSETRAGLKSKQLQSGLPTKVKHNYTISTWNQHKFWMLIRWIRLKSVKALRVYTVRLAGSHQDLQKTHTGWKQEQTSVTFEHFVVRFLCYKINSFLNSQS